MIASFGEAVIDLAADGAQRCGGAPFNVALGLGRLRKPSAFIGALSDGADGEPFAELLSDAGVSTEFTKRVPAPMLRATATARDGEIEYDFDPIDSADQLLMAPPLGALGASDALHVGSLAVAREHSGAVVEEFCERFDGFLSLDPNVRMSMVEDVERWRERVMRLVGRADLVKLSDEDGVALFPGRTEQAILHRLLEAGPSVIVLTKGRAGVSCYLESGQLQMGALEVDVVDSIGAGDSFMAGLLAGLSERDLLHKGALRGIHHEALRPALWLASACAAVTCGQPGPYAAIRTEIETLLTIDID